MKGTAIKGLPIEPVDEARGRGTVGDLVLDTDQRRVTALQLLWSTTTAPFTVAVGDVRAVTPNAVVLNPLATILPLADTPQYLSKPTLNRLIGEPALLESGKTLGDVSDVEIDPSSWAIVSYAVLRNMPEAFKRGLDEIPAERVTTGAESLLVRDA